MSLDKDASRGGRTKNRQQLKKLLRVAFWFVFCVPIALAIAVAACVSRFRKHRVNPKVMFGVDPLISNKYWKRCLDNAESWVVDVYAINQITDFDFVMSRRMTMLPHDIRRVVSFILMELRFDVVVLSFNGAFLGVTPLAVFEPLFLRLARVKTIVFPYGGDSYVYRRTATPDLRHALLLSYPEMARQQAQVARRVERWERNADIVVTGVMSPDGFGRWDCIIPQVVFIDEDLWSESSRTNRSDGSADPVVIAHTPNHRGFKGTEFVVDAVQQLRDEGLNVELRLLEGMRNEGVRKTLEDEVDILVEQLIFTGNGLSGFEGMATGLPVVCNLEDDSFQRLMRRYTYFAECPLVSGSPESIIDVLRRLVKDPELRRKLGAAGRQYVRKYHGIVAGSYFLDRLVAKVWKGEDVNLMTLYHPILGEFSKRSPRVTHPLVKNKLPAIAVH